MHRPRGASASGANGVVYLELRWACLPSMVRNSLFGGDSWSLRSRLGTRSDRWLRRLFRISVIDIARVDDFVIVPGSSESAMRRALDAIEAAGITPVFEYLAAALPRVPNGVHAIGSALLKPIGQRSLDAFYVECWARSMGWTRTRVVSATSWDSLLLTDPPNGLRTVGHVSRALGSSSDVLTRALHQARQRLWHRRSAHRAARPTAATSSDGARPSAPVGPVGAQARQARVALVLNLGLVFGRLYAYDHVLDSDPSSPLSMRNLVHMSSDGGPGHPDGIAHGYPPAGSPLRVLRMATRLAFGARSRAGRRFPWSWAVALSWTVASAKAQSEAVTRAFPELEVAVVAYEVQLPIAFSLALQQAGVRTIAFNERPLSAMVESQPFVIGTLLTAGPAFSTRVATSRAITTTNAPATGMWRTDLLREYADAAHPAWPKDRRRVLALPYHVETRPGFGNNPLALSPEAVRQFITDCLALASRRADVHVIIRGKNDRWHSHPQMSDLVERIARMDNVDVSHEYRTLNESYRLAATADLVLAQYTSLADEVLAVGTPCVLHDYLPNSRGYGRGIATHLPDMLWALDEESWHERIEDALADSGARFRRAWEPFGAELYGDLADGHVRERARRLILDLLD